MHIPRIIISGLSGGAGKTMVSLGLARFLARSGLRVKAFKKGPDYIDAAWLALAARSPQANLDPFFLPAPALRSLFLQGAAGRDMALIEGNRGIFDGLDLSGSCSTAELSRILLAPVLLVLDCTKMTRTAAALVSGCLNFEKGVRIGGVILNRTGNPRHQTMVRRAIEELAGVPVLGVLPRRRHPFIVERHMGLAGLEEYARADEELDALADFLADHADLEAIKSLAASAPDLPEEAIADESSESRLNSSRDRGDFSGGRGSAPDPAGGNDFPQPPPLLSRDYSQPDVNREQPATRFGPGLAADGPRPRIGYVRDAAFWFYYEENLNALRTAGADMIPLSLLEGGARQKGQTGESGRINDWDRLDGLYIGGGQPELYAQALADNHFCRERVAALARAGLPIYAECGGFMYLARELIVDGAAFPMAGVFSCSVEFLSRPQGLGYVEAEVVAGNPFHPLGARFRGHEFHFSRCVVREDRAARDSGLSGSDGSSQAGGAPGGHILRLHKGRGMSTSPDQEGFDGLLIGNTFAAYTHVFAPALPHWAKNFVALCAARKRNP